MVSKVNLDALIQREDFEVIDESNISSSSRNITTLSIRDFEESSFFFSALRKPDFQRETSEWDSVRVCEFIKSFLEGELIPAIILWRNAGSYTFVIDGSHRVSSLASWINDDYGDGHISIEFYEGNIPDKQKEIAKETRKIINKEVGAFKQYQLAVKHPDGVDIHIKKRARNLAALAIQVQWVEGDASKAEASYFKINQQAAPIDKTEIKLLKARKKPNGVATRAVIRSGKGHKYWSSFSSERQVVIQQLATEINQILFQPSLKNPIKTLDLPVAGKTYSKNTLSLVLDFVNIVNNVKKPLEDDIEGIQTIKFLKRCKKIVQRINSIHPSSLGLHPAIYFYGNNGRHKVGSFYAIAALIMEFENYTDDTLFKNFTKVRSDFEYLLIKYDYLVQQIIRKYRSVSKGYPHIKDYYLFIIHELSQGNSRDKVIDRIIANRKFNYLKTTVVEHLQTDSPNFSRETKSAIFIKEALSNTPQCKICGGFLHTNSISIDHIERKADGGLGNIDNGQLTHPYCNSTYKN